MIFPVIDAGDTVGYMARHTWSKEEIDLHNRCAARNGDYKMLRWRNSTENDFVKLLYHYDGIVEGEADTVILLAVSKNSKSTNKWGRHLSVNY